VRSLGKHRDLANRATLDLPDVDFQNFRLPTIHRKHQIRFAAIVEAGQNADINLIQPIKARCDESVGEARKTLPQSHKRGMPLRRARHVESICFSDKWFIFALHFGPTYVRCCGAVLACEQNRACENLPASLVLAH
jgi:hypothetical protein